MMQFALSLMVGLMMAWPQAMAGARASSASSDNALCHHCACGGARCCVEENPVETPRAPFVPASASLSHEFQIGLPASAVLMPAAALEASNSLSYLPAALLFPSAPLFQRFCVYLI